jgi:lipopolysaccharide transport system permease protein
MSDTTASPGPESSADDSGWTTVIRPTKGAFDWRLGELWRYRDLILLFVWRDFVAYYKQTILGPLWHVVQPLMTTVTFTLIFGRVAGLPTDGAPPFLFYMAGNVVWAYFATCLSSTSTTFVKNAPLLGKVYFHRLVIPVSIVLSSLIAFAIQFVLFLIFVAGYLFSGSRIPVSSSALLTPVWVLMLAGYGLGGGVIVSALTTRYRDLTFVVGFGVQLLMYATPVIYPVSAVPEKYQWIVRMNPLAPLIESFRHGFVGGTAVNPMHLLYSAVALVVLLVVGLILFSRVERTFMDTV